MSRPRSIYVLSMRSIFHFHRPFHYDYSYNLLDTDTLVLLLIFRICSIILDANVYEECE